MKKEILLIQPPLLKSQMEVDLIEQKYWDVLNQSVNRIFEEINIDKELLKAEKNFSGFHEPNIGLLYIAGMLKQNDYPVNYLDLHLMDAYIRFREKRPVSMMDIEAKLMNISFKDVAVVGLSPLTVNYEWCRRIAKFIKENNPDVKILLGGVHVSFLYEEILRSDEFVDVISVGESERTVVELLDVLSSNGYNIGKELKEVEGLAFRLDDELVFTGKRNLNISLDELPYPAYDLLPKEYVEKAILRVLTSRGCVNNCIFCVPSKIFNRVNFRDPKTVVDEIEHHYKKYNCKTFMIGDLNFINNYDFAVAFCNELIDRKLSILWMCQSRTDLIDEKIAVLMKKAGCVMVCLGIESADELVLAANKKNITTEKSVVACEVVKKVGLKVFTYWAFGLPGETHQSAQLTINLLKKLLQNKLLDYTHITVVVPYPGTMLYKKPEKYNIKILSKDFEKYWLGCDYLGSGLPVARTEELSEYEIYAYWQLAMSIVIDKLL